MEYENYIGAVHLPYSQPYNSALNEIRSLQRVGLMRTHCAIIGTSNTLYLIVSASTFPLNIYKRV